MKGRVRWISVSVVALLLALARWSGLAQGPEERVEPPGGVSIEALVSPHFSYQGMLREDGSPVTGTRDMVFQFYSDGACTATVGSAIPVSGVAVEAGIFSVELALTSNYVNGQRLWLGIQVEGTTVGCQEILAVPYALSLRPGARIQGEQPNWDALHAVNTATLSLSYGVYARSDSSEGRGAYGYASATTGSAYGVYGRSDSSDGAGVYARGKDAGADLVLAGNAATSIGDDGRIFSDPDYPSSDIVLVANDNIRIDLDQDGDGEDADFEIYDAANTMIFGVDESGAVTYGGTGIAAFPRPAYDSGWVSVSAGNTALLTHNLGGNVDKYVVDFACKVGGNAGIRGIGGDYSGTQYWGAYWDDLTSSQIELVRWPGDSSCPQMRVRIWMYP